MKSSSNKNSKLPIDQVNSGIQAKIDKAHNADAIVSEDSNGVRITSDGLWIGISPANARLISASLLISADKADKLKAGKVK